MLQQPFKVFNSTVRQLKTPTHELMHWLRPKKKIHQKKNKPLEVIAMIFQKMVIHSFWKMIFTPTFFVMVKLGTFSY